MITNLANIRIVLVNTTHPGNIGSAARAMKTMGLTKLVLVGPKTFPSHEATAMAAGADDVLERAEVAASLEDAIAGCGLVIGTSARSRSLPWPMLSTREVGENLLTQAAVEPVALVFGREHAGLTNEELQLCHYHVQIPANPDYSSLNLAQAVQVLCYEIRMAAIDETKELKGGAAMAKEGDMEKFYTHLETVLKSIEFLDPENPGQLMPRLRRLFAKARVCPQELNILRGIMAAIQKNNDT